MDIPPPTSGTGWVDAEPSPRPGPIAAAAGAAWVIHGGRLWRAVDGRITAVDLPFAPDAVVAAGDGVAAIASAAGGRGHLALLGADGALRRDLLLDATVTGLVERRGELWVTVRGLRPASLDGLLTVRDDGGDTRLFGCADIHGHRGPVGHWEGLFALPATGPPRAIAATLGSMPSSLGGTIAWAAGTDVSWVGPADSTPRIGRLPAPAVESRAGRGGVAARWEAGNDQGISVLTARGAGLVEMLRRGARDALPDGGDLGAGAGWVAWEQEYRDRKLWRVMTVDLASGAVSALTGPLPAPPRPIDDATEAALRALEPEPTWYLPSPVRERLGHVTLGVLDLAASGVGVVARDGEGNVRWTARYPVAGAAAGGEGYACRAGRTLVERAWTFTRIAETPEPEHAALGADGAVRFMAEGTLWSWTAAGGVDAVARLPGDVVSVDLGATPLVATGKGRIYALERGWRRLPGRTRALAVATGPAGPVVLGEGGEVAALDGTLLAPLDPSGPATAIAAGPTHVLATTVAGAQILAGGSRIPLDGVDAPTEILAPDDAFVVGQAGGRPGVWRWGADPDRPDVPARFVPFVRGDVPIFPGGSPPETLADLAAGGGQAAVRVGLRGGGSGVILVDGCAVSPIVGDGSGVLPDGTTVASARGVGPGGTVLLAAPADLEGVWTLYLATPGSP